MDNLGENEKKNEILNKINTFCVPYVLGEIEDNITEFYIESVRFSGEKVIKIAIKYHLEGNILMAAKYYKYLISKGFSDHRLFSNYGIILQSFNKIDEAEILTRKAIDLKPDYAIAYSNLGGILIDLGKLEEAEFYTRRALELNPIIDKAQINLGIIYRNRGKLEEAELYIRKAIELNSKLSKAYFVLSNFKCLINDKRWEDQLFSESIFYKQLDENKIDIYFARANLLHKEKRYKESARNLQLANGLKLDLRPSNYDSLIRKTSVLSLESSKKEINNTIKTQYPISIFIVGMPRSGSTLVESILSMNKYVKDLGEINVFEESFIQSKKDVGGLTLADLYFEKANQNKNQSSILTNKWLYNYQYAGIIASQIPNAKILHCFRNPLDNILSLYRAHFARGNEYSSSLVDSARVYLNQNEIMKEYKKKFRSKIYDLNYDSLVSYPKREIQSLISWLGWQWNDSYLTPHLSKRSVLTASNIEVRSPVNSKSIGGWKNYKDMLKPAMDIMSMNSLYSNQTYN